MDPKLIDRWERRLKRAGLPITYEVDRGLFTSWKKTGRPESTDELNFSQDLFDVTRGCLPTKECERLAATVLRGYCWQCGLPESDEKATINWWFGDSMQSCKATIKEPPEKKNANRPKHTPRLYKWFFPPERRQYSPANPDRGVMFRTTVLMTAGEFEEDWVYYDVAKNNFNYRKRQPNDPDYLVPKIKKLQSEVGKPPKHPRPLPVWIDRFYNYINRVGTMHGYGQGSRQRRRPLYSKDYLSHEQRHNLFLRLRLLRRRQGISAPFLQTTKGNWLEDNICNPGFSGRNQQSPNGPRPVYRDLPQG